MGQHNAPQNPTPIYILMALAGVVLILTCGVLASLLR